MSLASTHRDGSFIPALALRYALREFRGGLRGFYVFIACIALGVFTIAGVGSLADSLSEGLAREGRTLLGGDVSFVLFQREANPAEIAFLHSRGQVSAAATLRAMAKAADGELALVEIKAVDELYPMLGSLTLKPELSRSDLLGQQGGAFGAAADPTLLARLDLKIGDTVTIGDASFQIRSVLQAEPDKLAGGLGFGPRFLVSLDALRATHLLQPGSLVRWLYRVKLQGEGNDRALAALIEDARITQSHAGWEVRSRANASPQLERT
ncbi:MAG: ABC transporter permease, partial [Bradyrhizobium sp.]|nr:ABC transporter permease [Bradyrhizobium sp.]